MIPAKSWDFLAPSTLSFPRLMLIYNNLVSIQPLFQCLVLGNSYLLFRTDIICEWPLTGRDAITNASLLSAVHGAHETRDDER